MLLLTQAKYFKLYDYKSNQRIVIITKLLTQTHGYEHM